MQVSLLPLVFLTSLGGILNFAGVGLSSELISQPGQRRLELLAPTFSGSPPPPSKHTRTLELLYKASVLLLSKLPRPKV